MLKTYLVNPINKVALAIKNIFGREILLTQTFGSVEGTFKAVTRTGAGTSTITEPGLDGSILLTDLILTTDKVALATVTVRLTDDTETINIITANVADAPVNLSIPFAGKWQGWKNARLELVTVNAVTATVACGYTKICKECTLSYSEWDAER